MKLPIVDVFSSPYYDWSYRDVLPCELQTVGLAEILHGVKDKLIINISNHFEAAKYMAEIGADNGLEHYIDDQLVKNKNFISWRRCMPSVTPKALKDYQQKYPDCNFENVTAEINKLGLSLSEGQYLFHGGVYPDKKFFITDRPFSTTFCPQVALRSAEWRGKAYDAGRIDLFVLRVVNPKTNIFLYKTKGTNLGHEKEVLFASGAQLEFKSRTPIREDYLVAAYERPNKLIPIYIVEVDIS